MNRQRLIEPSFLRIVGCAGASGELLAIAIPILCILEPLAWFVGFPGASVIIGYASDAMSLLLLGLLGMLCPWCHEVLTARRGSVATRYLSLLLGVFGWWLFLDTLFGSIARISLLTHREFITLSLPLGLLFTLIVNINNIAAAPLRMRISLPLACLFYLGLAFTIGIIPLLLPFTLFKAAAAALLISPLAVLRRNAPRIASLPEDEE